MDNIRRSLILFWGTWLVFWAASAAAQPDPRLLLNDVHSALNATQVRELYEPQSAEEIVGIVKKAKEDKVALSISGGKHAMGGQQFGNDTVHINMSQMNKVVHFDRKMGTITVEAGLQWPQLVEY